MHYALFQIINSFASSPEDIGLQIENELSKLSISTSINSIMDWGYTFRIENSQKVYDISIIQISTFQFGLAIEKAKGIQVLQALFGLFAKNNIETVKAWLDEILSEDVGVISIKWYSEIEWEDEFKTSFWNTVSI